MLQPALRRRLLAAATPSRLALGAGFVLGGAAAGLALHSDAPPEEAELRAQTVVAEAAPWQPPWLRPPRSVVMEDASTRASRSDPLVRRPRRRVRLPGQTPAAHELVPGSGIDVSASAADPESIRASVGGGDILPPVGANRKRVPLPAWDRDPVGPVLETPVRRARRAPDREAPAARVASTSPSGDGDADADGGSDAPPTRPRPPRVASVHPAPLDAGPSAVEPRLLSKPPPAKPAPHPAIAKLPLFTTTAAPGSPKPAPSTPKQSVPPVAKPAPHGSPVVSLRPILPGVPAELAPPSPPSDVIVLQHDEVEKLVAANAFRHGQRLHVADGGQLGGSGRVEADVRVAGVFAPGHSPGYVEIQGDYVQEPGAILEIELAGTDASEFDRVVIEGSAYLSGVIQVLLLNGFVPIAGDVFEVLLAEAIGHLGVDIRLPDLGPGLSLQADWLSTEAGDSLVLRTQGGASGAEVATAIPEPTALLLLAAGLLGLALRGSRV